MTGIVIAGASIAGLTVAEQLRARGDDRPILLLGAEPHLPYSRPPLTKQLLAGDGPLHAAFLADPARLGDLGVRIELGEPVRRADLDRRIVATARAEHPFDVLVAATGSRARSLPEVPGARTVRTIDDALAMHAELGSARRVIVVGGGVLACELAAAARTRGTEVVLLARGAGLALGAIGTLLSEPLVALLERHGVDVRRGVAVVGAERVGDRTRVRCSDGGVVEGDLVLAAVGASPVTEWLEGNGLDLADGIRCDAAGRFARDAFAVGDVARWTRRDGTAVRVEHQTNAVEQAISVAATIAGGEPVEPGPAYFWSELFGERIQVVGDIPRDAVARSSAGDVRSGRFVLEVEHDGRLVGVVGWSMPKEFRAARRRLADAQPALAPEGTR